MAYTLVIFGASGDLTRRKLIPALLALSRKGRLPERTRIVGFSRTPMSDDAWREQLAASTQQIDPAGFDADAWRTFASRVFYQPGDLARAEDVGALRQRLEALEGGEETTRVYYLSTAPQLYQTAIRRLGAAGMAEESRGPVRIVVEKPFGVDLASAQALNAVLHEVFAERQVYRIDHYLGKETVQNLLVLRFANSIFEPLWNRNYIDHVQISVGEELPVGSRGAYYDCSGVLRDMFQNHLLQLLMVNAMEAPSRFEADQVRDEKVKVLRAVRPLDPAQAAEWSLRGQYAGYLDEPGVRPHSRTATWAALRLWIDNWRWQGVPFFLRSGKAMPCRSTQIVVEFRRPPHLLFDVGAAGAVEPNRLLIQIQPAEGIQIHFQTKTPDAGMRLRTAELDFRFSRLSANALPDAYQRLLLDTLYGDASLFARRDEVELAWSLIDPVHAGWEGDAAPPLELYAPGTWGPAAAAAWIQAQGRQWFDVCPVLH